MNDRAVEILEMSNIRLFCPGATLTGAPLVCNTGSNATTGTATTGLLYVYSTVDFHIKISTASPATAASTNDAPFPGLTPLLFSVPLGSRVAVVKRDGVADGTTWVHNVIDTTRV
jgi:hypothetical protein